MASQPDVAAGVRQAAAAINAGSTVPETLQAIVDAAVQSLPGIDHAGITLVHRDGRLETAASTSALVRDLDELQYDVGEGPCLSALEDGNDPVVLVEHAQHEARWHAFIPQAVERGVTAQLGVRMFISEDDVTIGVLNLYSTSSETLEQDTKDTAELFATHAALAYRHQQEVDHLHDAMTSREVIGKAIGIVMERYGLDSGRAFGFLTRVSSATERKLRDIALELVTDTDRANTVDPA